MFALVYGTPGCITMPTVAMSEARTKNPVVWEIGLRRPLWPFIQNANGGAINPTAGLITATATTSRQLQFGLKVNF